jgi:hypothetical protein
MSVPDLSTIYVEVLEVIAHSPESPLYSRQFSIQEIKDEFLSLQGTKERMGLSSKEYARSLKDQGKLEGIRVDMGHYSQWFITKESILYYETHILRSKKPRNYRLRLFSKDYATAIQALDAAGIFYQVELEYVAPERPLDALKA